MRCWNLEVTWWLTPNLNLDKQFDFVKLLKLGGVKPAFFYVYLTNKLVSQSFGGKFFVLQKEG
jgi:hypothetical protein